MWKALAVKNLPKRTEGEQSAFMEGFYAAADVIDVWGAGSLALALRALGDAAAKELADPLAFVHKGER